MNTRTPSLCAATVAVTLLSAGAFAQSLRCKTDLVSPGDSRASVLQKCGEPVVNTLRFEAGKLVSINYGDRVK